MKHFKFQHAAAPHARGQLSQSANSYFCRSCCHWGLAAVIRPREWAEGGVWSDVASCAFPQVGPGEVPPHLPLVFPGKILHWSGRKETLQQVPDCLARWWEVSSSLSVSLSACWPWRVVFMKPPVLKSTRTDDFKEDNAFMPVKG